MLPSLSLFLLANNHFLAKGISRTGGDGLTPVGDHRCFFRNAMCSSPTLSSQWTGGGKGLGFHIFRTLRRCFSNLGVPQSPPKGLGEHRLRGPHRASDSGAASGWGLGICSLNKVPGETEAAMAPTLEPLLEAPGSHQSQGKTVSRRHLLHVLIEATAPSRWGYAGETGQPGAPTFWPPSEACCYH